MSKLDEGLREDLNTIINKVYLDKTGIKIKIDVRNTRIFLKLGSSSIEVREGSKLIEGVNELLENEGHDLKELELVKN